jgi:DNA-binding PadR family transcriptional regulator
LAALAIGPREWRYGYELGQEVGLKSGSLYPILMRLSDRGWLEAEWEDDVPPGRPPRHLYRLTASGEAAAAYWAPARGPGAAVPGVGADFGLRGAW